jgi:hypothetical protein
MIAEQCRADVTDHTDRVFRACFGHADNVAAMRNSLFQSRALMVEVDAMLAKGDKALIEEYYSAAKKGP